MALLRGLNCESKTEEVCRSGLDVAHPDFRHLCGVQLHLLDLGSFAVFPFFIKLDLVGGKICGGFLLFLFFVFCLWNKRLDQFEIFLCVTPTGSLHQGLLIGLDGFGIAVQTREGIALVVPGLGGVIESERVEGGFVVAGAGECETFPDGVLIMLGGFLVLALLACNNDPVDRE